MYAQLARFYDLTHADLNADLSLLDALVAEVGGPVLELGCGTGRVALHLARGGTSVTGVDNEAEMLTRARRKLAQALPAMQARVTLLEGDMTRLVLGNGRFALALLTHNTFMHFDAARAAGVLQQVRGVLAENGRLFIDVMNPLRLEMLADDRALQLENLFTDPDTGDIVLQLSSSWLDDAEQCLRAVWIYDMSPAEGGAVVRTAVQTAYHYLHPHAYEQLLVQNGFSLLEMMGDYDRAPFEETSERLLMLAAAA